MIQQEIFGRKIIKNISFDENEILRSISVLHNNSKPFQLDPTYSRGIFYKNFPDPELKYDLEPQTNDTKQADCRQLPFDNSTISSIIFDPPFVIGGTGKSDHKNGSNIISKRFSSFKTVDKMVNLYEQSLREFKRILAPGGLLLFKNQDQVSSGRQIFSHCIIYNMAIELGLIPIDLFILLAKSRIIGGKHKRQMHARKYNSYWWVFKNNKEIN